MIHYSSIKDAWGKKDMFKNNIHSGKFTNIYESATNCQVQPMVQPMVQPTTQPETFTQKDSIKYDIHPQPQVMQPVIQPHVVNEHFAQNSCAFMEHLQNCPFCMGRMKEHFSETTTSVVPEIPISIINIFGFEINITKDVLKVLFIIILIVIFILLLRMVNVSFKKANNKYLNIPNAELINLMTQMKYFNPTISQL